MRCDRKRTTLAASFVVTVSAAGALEAGCKKHGPTHTTSIQHEADGTCWLHHHVECPRFATCNPPPPAPIDCPSTHRDAGEPAPSPRRPPGKEDWLRMTPHLWANEPGKCTYAAAYFCPPPGREDACVGMQPGVTVECTSDDGGGPMRHESFVYKDAFGECRRVAAKACAAPGRRSCTVMEEGERVDCP